jgi:hypothetical protein
MHELKVVCFCGQKYKFDVEPVNGQMPFVVNCPVCGLEGTSSANAILATMPGVASVTMAAPAMAVAGSSLRAAPPSAPAIPPPRPAPAGRPITAAGAIPKQPKYLQDNAALQNNSFILGTVGAIIGAVFSVGLMVGAQMFFGYCPSIVGIAMGALIGFAARLFYKGTDSTLGGMSAAVAFVTIGGTLYLMFGLLGIAFDIIYLLIGTAMAFKIASG